MFSIESMQNDKYCTRYKYFNQAPEHYLIRDVDIKNIIRMDRYEITSMNFTLLELMDILPYFPQMFILALRFQLTKSQKEIVKTALYK